MRAVCIALVLYVAASLAYAQVPDDLKSCATESDNTRRLACYDKEMARVARPAPAHETVPSTASGASNLSPAQEFGLGEERVRKRKATQGAPEVSALTAKVTKISQLPNGLQRFALDNAQVWEQTEEDFGFNPQPGATVTITRGMLGGFWMAIDAYRKVRVKRIH